MSRGDYYRQQANLLLTWASETSDPERAAALEARARELIGQANFPDDWAVADLGLLIDEFNNQEMRKAASVRQPQQQQQAQPKKEK